MKHLHEWRAGFEAIGQAFGRGLVGYKKRPILFPPRHILVAK
jgi:hypothetical protein